MYSIIYWFNQKEMKNSGMYFQLSDGRKGIAYNKEQTEEGRFKINLLDDSFNPIISEKTGKQAIVFKHHTEVKLIGFVD